MTLFQTQAFENSAGLGAFGIAALKRGDASGALDALKRAVQLSPDDAEMQQGLGAALLALGQYAAADGAYRTAVALDPARVDALRGIGHAARRLGNRLEALHWFETACAMKPEAAKHHHEVGEELRALGRLPEARNAFAQALAIQPDHRPSLLSCAAVAREQGDLREALRILDIAETHAPADPTVRRDKAVLLERLGLFDAAAALYQTLLDTAATRVDALRGLTALARHRGNAGEVINLLREEASRRDDPGLRLEIASLQVDQGGDPAEIYAHLLAQPATQARACSALVLLARREQDRARARSWLEAAVAADPFHSPAGRALAELCRLSGDVERAADVLARLAAGADRDPTVPAAQGRLARACGQQIAARDFFERAYALDPCAGVADFACALRDAGAHDRALLLIEEALATRPDDVGLLVQHGVTLRAAGDAIEALARFDTALSKQRDHVSALIEKAVTLLRLGRFAALRALLDEIAVIAPHHSRLLELRADLALMEDNPDEVLAALRQAAATGSASSALAGKRARCEAALGHIEEGLRAIDEASDASGPSPDLLVLKAQMLRQYGRISETREVFDGAVVQFPHSFSLWFHRALFVAETGDPTTISLGPPPACLPAEVAKTAVVAGVVAASRWQFARAASQFRRALDHHPADVAIRARLAASALLDLDLDETERQLRRIAKIEAPARRLRGQSLSPFKTLVGQILDEARIDKEALGRLSEARRLPQPVRLDALAAIVRDRPDMTLGAMQMTIALRRLGQFDRPHHRRDGNIPRSIVQFWHAGDPPPDVRHLCQSWQAWNDGFAYRRFSDSSALAFLHAEYPRAVAEAYGQARDPARKADIFRLAYLAHAGGVYADADDRCVGPLDTLLARGDALVAYQEDIGSIGNNFIAATPRHPVILRALDRAVASAAAGDSDIPWLATGPGLMTRVLAEMIAEEGSGCIARLGLKLITRRALLTYAAIGCTTAYKHTSRHWSRAAFLAPSAKPV